MSASIVAPEARRANAHMTAAALDAYAAMGLLEFEGEIVEAATA